MQTFARPPCFLNMYIFPNLLFRCISHLHINRPSADSEIRKHISVMICKNVQFFFYRQLSRCEWQSIDVPSHNINNNKKKNKTINISSIMSLVSSNMNAMFAKYHRICLINSIEKSTAREEIVLSRKSVIVPYSEQVHFSPHPHISLGCINMYIFMESSQAKTIKILTCLLNTSVTNLISKYSAYRYKFYSF